MPRGGMRGLPPSQSGCILGGMAGQRTGAQRTDAHSRGPSRVVRPGEALGFGYDGPPPAWRPVEEDRKTRKAYRVPELRSPYLTRIDIPDRVAAGDEGMAKAIVRRVQRVLDDHGRYTGPERKRLRNLLRKWEKRAGGEDSYFNMRGWRRDEGQVAWETRRDREMGKKLDEIRDVISGRGEGE